LITFRCWDMDEEFTCRICLEEGERLDFIAPCACAGSQRWVHRECLDKWRSMREDKAFSRCTECLKPYTMICLSQDDDNITWKRRCRFTYMILRDLCLVLLISQFIILFLGLIVFGLDKHSHLLIDTLRMSARPTLFYYLCGVFFTLSILGMCYTGQQMGCCRGNGTHSNDCGTNDCICGNVYVPFIYTSPEAGSVQCCACHPECCACCGDSAGTGGAGGCAECAGGSAAGEECVMFMVVVLVVFALVGAFICVVLGVAYVQGLVRTHYHVLQKYTLATDFIVADLAEGALPIPYYAPNGGGVGRIENTHGDYRGDYMQANTQDNDFNDTAELEQGQQYQGQIIELSSYTSSPLYPSAPPALVPMLGAEMDRDLHVTDSNKETPSAPPAEDANDFHLPYNPVSHNFSESQYNDLRRRNLI